MNLVNLKMESEKIARLVVPALGNGAFQFPISPEFKINIELTELNPETFDSIYDLFDKRYRLSLTVMNLKSVIEGDFTHFELKEKDENGNLTCLIQMTNISSFYYNPNLSFD